MNKHQRAIDLIEADIESQAKKVDYFSKLLARWPHLTYDMEKAEQTISRLQHTREVLVLIGDN